MAVRTHLRGEVTIETQSFYEEKTDFVEKSLGSNLCFTYHFWKVLVVCCLFTVFSQCILTAMNFP